MTAPAGVAGLARLKLKRVVRRTHELLGDYPVLLPLHLVLTPESVRARRITTRTDLVIEGFPRSGNTYAAIAFQQAQPTTTVVASHVHIPAQVRRAVTRQVPTLLVVRRPEDAVVSMGVADAHHRVASLLRYWVHYHEQVAPLLDGLVVGTFDQVTTDLGSVVDRVNGRFGTDFARPGSGSEDVEAAFAAIEAKQRSVHGPDGFHEGVARPDERRREAADRRRRELEETAAPRMRARADELYRVFAARA